MNDERAFLRAIAENPGDDLPRLVYADWLEDQRDEDFASRGAFIRAQTEGRTPDAPPPDGWACELLGLSPSLNVGRCGTWRGEAIRWVWQRGFPNQVVASMRWVVHASGPLFGLLPVTHLWLNASDLSADQPGAAGLAFPVPLDRLFISATGRVSWIPIPPFWGAPEWVRQTLAGGAHFRFAHQFNVPPRAGGRGGPAFDRPHPFDVCQYVALPPTVRPHDRCPRRWETRNEGVVCGAALPGKWPVRHLPDELGGGDVREAVCPSCMTVYHQELERHEPWRDPPSRPQVRREPRDLAEPRRAPPAIVVVETPARIAAEATPSAASAAFWGILNVAFTAYALQRLLGG